MLSPAISKVREFLSSWKNLVALGTLPILGAWIFSRVWMVNPAILGDEYLYSMNARKVGSWDPPVAGDFSNYLFNFVYQGTNLCGDAFYTCGKLFNIVFFLGFVFTLFILALRFLPFWGAYAFLISAALSPLSVYTSMFLPESMYFFFIGLVLVAVLRAMRAFTWQNWALAGAAIGIASLVKPHAWLSAIAVGITMLVVGLFNKDIGFKTTFVAGLGLVAGAALARVAAGLLVAGPKALGFFGQYFGVSTIETVIAGTGSEAAVGASSPTTPVGGVVALFGPQLNIHLLTISALMALSVVGLISGILEVIREKRLSSVSGFALFGFIWLFSMMLEIVLFTGWVTGTGDDHTTRVLLRYYDFLFVIVPLAGLAAFTAALGERVNVFFRWATAGLFAALITQAFTGFFATLTIQIADAPALAGLVVNQDIFNAAAVLSFASLLLFATFPRWMPWAFIVLLPVTMIGTGWQIQDQYQGFRGTVSVADSVGQKIAREFTSDQLSRTWVIGTSRFEATNAAFWADNAELSYELMIPGSALSGSLAPEGTAKIVVIGDVQITDGASLEFTGEGYAIYNVD
ncbi:hypothetical protein N9M34_00515 [Aquiluna sp.]|nr:hypothetical protein [Aquiluna sp.]